MFADYRTAEADEAYVIGKRGQYTPVGAYLAGDEIIKIAVEHGAQMIHPGMLRPALSKGEHTLIFAQVTGSCLRTPSLPARLRRPALS